jgi:TonB family protein
VFQKGWRALLTAALLAGIGALPLRAQEAESDIAHRAKTRVQPAYPELARKMNLRGTVKVQLIVAANGTVKEAKVIGGHPVLANAALEAAKRWRFEPAPAETTGVVEFKFEPNQ